MACWKFPALQTVLCALAEVWSPVLLLLLQVLDRLVLGQLLGELQRLPLAAGLAARAPRYCQVEDYAAADLTGLLSSKGVGIRCPK
jgi:hypothetical protein